MNEYFEASKHLWNQRTPVHKDCSFYDLEGNQKNLIFKLALVPASWVLADQGCIYGYGDTYKCRE
jgi:hypothetical protein